MKPYLINLLLHNIGVGEEGTDEALGIRAANREYCIKQIESWNETITGPEIDGHTLGDLNSFAWAFVDGYKAALK